ncbi:MAG: DNA methylase N-4 [Candidatus Fonsibacter lacus]|nr:DNA methylase N-4 [Candidatus Fonsibacter lacus]
MEYLEFLEKKIVVAKDYGTKINEKEINEKLLPHQKDIVKWAIEGGRRAIFASFGLGKTIMQLELAVQVSTITKKPFLIVMPLGVVGEFKDDLEFLYPKKTIKYITDSDVVDVIDSEIVYVTNYERIRKGDVTAELFGGVSFDEASILRNLKTETTNYVLKHFKDVNYRFVATATPTPNDFIEILNYADYLGVIDRGHALTRFFQRDSTKAGSLTLYENKKSEFWKWVSSWAIFINKPSDLGYDDEGYLLPKMNLNEVLVENLTDKEILNKRGERILFKDTTKSLVDVSREKSESINLRVSKAAEIVENNKNDNWILWHHLESERQMIDKIFRDNYNIKSVYGSQTNKEKEDLLIDFKHKKYQILSTKPKIAGSGCNFQRNCNNMIFVGIDYKFNDFIQAIHRCYRFKQDKEVNVFIIYTQNEQDVLKALKDKWRKHIELQTEMINIVREYGLNTDKIKSDMKRQIFKNRRSSQIGNAKVFNEDTVVIHNEIETDSVDMVLTSIPFGDHYEYSDNYNDMGHNHGNDEFFKQMDFLTPNLLRTLKPGKVAAIHVKDRIRYSYQNGTSFTTIDDFSGKTVAHFIKHGFYLMGKITVTTDVVRENNQTYRLGWSEQCKDATKMGVGLPEYILLFRKAPTFKDNAYADVPCIKTKEEYTRANWQLDAHAYWKSDGNRFFSMKELSTMDVSKITSYWKKHNIENIYSFQEHLNICEILEEQEKLSSLFMTLPNHSNNELVWTDVNRMNTLNTNQANRKKEKHICPLQLDIIERLINRYSMKGDLINDPFGGLFSTAYKALEMERKAISTELNPEYYNDGLFYLKSIEYKINVPTLFDLV